VAWTKHVKFNTIQKQKNVKKKKKKKLFQNIITNHQKCGYMHNLKFRKKIVHWKAIVSTSCINKMKNLMLFNIGVLNFKVSKLSYVEGSTRQSSFNEVSSRHWSDIKFNTLLFLQKKSLISSCIMFHIIY